MSNLKCPPKRMTSLNKAPCADFQDKFILQTDEDSKFDFWAIFCFPYKICSQICETCGALCTGSNQFMIFLMMLQWCVCKITRCANPDSIIFPYYFYMFCQIIILTVVFGLLWMYFGKTFVLPFFTTLYEAFVEDYKPPMQKNSTRLSFRKYCFRKSELFVTPPQAEMSSGFQFRPIMVITLVIEGFINGIL